MCPTSSSKIYHFLNKKATNYVYFLWREIWSAFVVDLLCIVFCALSSWYVYFVFMHNLCGWSRMQVNNGKNQVILIITRSNKTNLRFEIWLEQLGPVPDLASKICSLKNIPEIQIDPNRVIFALKFFKKLRIFAWQTYWTKNRLIKDPSESKFNRSDPNAL